MLKIVALYLGLTIFLVSGSGNVSNPIVATTVAPKAPAVTDVKHLPEPIPNNTTTSDPKVNTTTSAPITTTSPPPETTTSAPETTTPSPTPKPTPPKTTPVPIPTTTAAPTPAPTPKAGQWIVSGKNVTCIIVKMAVQFNVSYTNTENKIMWQEITLPNEANSTDATGSCDDKEQTLNITWHSGQDSLMIHFTKNDSTQKYAMHHVEVSLGSHEFPDTKLNASMELIHEGEQFPTKLSNSYRCAALQKLSLTMNNDNHTAGWLHISELQFQAFKTDKSANFGTVQDCVPDVPDVVPIAVGCVLTVLVIVVLAAYLIGRRRSQARGYLSM